MSQKGGFVAEMFARSRLTKNTLEMMLNDVLSDMPGFINAVQ